LLREFRRDLVEFRLQRFDRVFLRPDVRTDLVALFALVLEIVGDVVCPGFPLFDLVSLRAELRFQFRLLVL